MTDKTREAIWRLINQCVDDVVSITEKEKNPYASEAAYKAIAQDTLDRIASLITAQADGVTDEQIEAEALRYATKPLAPYLRSEVFADGARWGISKLAAPKPDGWRVKSLVWKHDDEFDIYDAWPLGDLIRYRIVDDFFLFIGDDDKSTEYPTLDLAKAAAESDYMERIGAALEKIGTD